MLIGDDENDSKMLGEKDTPNDTSRLTQLDDIKIA
jgi:hypothetical protein